MPAKKQTATRTKPTARKPATKRKPAEKKTDLERLQGTWHITSLELNGQTAPEVSFAAATIAVKKNKFISRGMGDPYTGTIEVDETRSPRTFDILFDSGLQNGIRNLGIYELDGDDWKFCIDMGGTARPKRFTTRLESGVALQTLLRGPAPQSRSKSSATSGDIPNSRGRKPAPELRSGEPTEIEGEWVMVSATFGGKPLAPDMVKWCTRITNGNVTKILARTQVMLDASFSLDVSRAPGHIDYINRSGSNKGKAQAGIYDLNGDDLRINSAAPGDPRPKDFTSLNGDGRSLTVWKRSGA